MIKTAGELINEAQNKIKCVDVISAKTIYDDANNAAIIDVRESSNFENSHLKGSINIPRGLLEFQIEKHCENSETIILTHCAAGPRATFAALTLHNMGYSNVHAISATYEEIKSVFG
ncbi:MAG: rhodanese-related sulfurtransferase [Candidatus Pseudothioglobus sp.]|jgi:phage shock protein E|tara:strand:+ start:1578 stop:1928 length:351 start_codon:yes stop_codon:yes gene_type:complete